MCHELNSLTFTTRWLLWLLGFFWLQAPFGWWRHARVYFDSAAGRRVWHGGSQPQICEARSRVDIVWCCICRSRSRLDSVSSRGRPGADGGLGNWLLLGCIGWLQLELQSEEWQKRSGECDRCWQLIHIQWNYCHVWLNHWINDSLN